MKRRGVTLLEMMIALSLFSVIGLLLAFAFKQAGQIYGSVSGSTDTRTVLAKAQAALARDLERTSFSSVNVATGPTSLGPFDGDVVWFLSAIDPVTDMYLRKSDGTPFWQRNILYYSVVPNNHAGLFGFNCSGGADVAGYEVQCPHKILIRKVIDSGAVTIPTDESTEEEALLPAQVAGYLSRPNGYDTSGFSEPGLEQVSLPAANLLSFRARLAPNPEWPREVLLNLDAVAIKTAQRELRIGSVALDETRFTSRLSLSHFPKLP